MIKYEKLLIALLLFSSVIFSQSVVNIGKVNYSGSDPTLVPISITGTALDSVKSISLQLKYDPAKIKFNHTISSALSGISGLTLPHSENISVASSSDGTISISWFNANGAAAVNLSGVIFNLSFNYLADFSEIKFTTLTIKNKLGAKLTYTTTNGWIAQNSSAAIVVQYPNGGEALDVVGISSSIKWTSVNVSNVDLDYTTDGSTWTSITTNISEATGSYTWTIPATINSANCKVKVTETGSAVSDQSDAAFTINSTSTVSLLSPNGGEDLKVGGLKKISWTFRNMLNVKLEYSTNASNPTPTWNTIAASVTATNLSYDWTIPNTLSADCKIRISNVDDETVIDISDNVFSISNTPVQVNVSSIVQAHLVKYGEVLAILYHWWDFLNPHWQLESATFNGSGVTYTARDTLIVDGAVPVNIGWLTSVNYLEMKFKFNTSVLKFDSLKTSVADLQNASISVDGDEVHFIWSGGKAIDLHGNIFDMYFSYVNLTRPIQWFPTGSGTFAAQTQPWLPTTILDSRNFSNIKVSKVSAKNSKNNIINTDSWFDGSLSVNNLPAVKILHPIRNEIVEVYSVTDTIKWSSKLVTNVAIQYSTNGGSSWNSITSSTPAINGSYVWTLPDVNSSTCKIRIFDESNSLTADTSVTSFTITNVKSLDLTSPDNADILKIGSRKYITWASKNVSNVKIDYTIDGVTWLPIIASTIAKSHSYTWTVPNTPSITCMVRVRDAADSTLQDISSGPFTINSSPVKVSISNVNTHTSPIDITVPITVDKVNSATYINFTVQYNPANLFFDVVTSSSALNTGMLGYSTDNNNIRIVWISSTPVDASGTLFSIKFKNYNGVTTPLTFGTPNQIKDSSGVLIPIELVNGLTDINDFQIPKSFSLSQNYPNPFNPSTIIRFELPKASDVNLSVYNILGQRIATLVAEHRIAGRYEVKWDASNVANGIYFYCIRTDGFVQTKKMILIK